MLLRANYDVYSLKAGETSMYIFYSIFYSLICSTKYVALFSAECTIGMVRGLTLLKYYGTMALWHYGTMALWQ